jgi:chemotaxis protein MotB
MKAAVIILSIIALGLAGGSYYFYNVNRKSQVELEVLRAAKEQLTVKVNNLEEEKTSITHELGTKITDISKQKEEEIAKVKGTYDELVTDMKNEIAQGQIKITQLADRLSVSMVDKILFPSGEADIMPDGVKVLQRVGKALKSTQHKTIRVEGHTDNVPISSRLLKQFPTNWELSTTRASNVVRFLQEKVGIEPVRLESVGMSEYHPLASNATATGRSQNRRIEILLLPELVSKPDSAAK